MSPKVEIVGIGASAGGLEAIESFFKNMPPDSGVAFVVVQHLSPHHKSHMAELLSKYTEMPVHQVQDGMAVERNNIYLIPPNKDLRLFHGKLLLNQRSENERGLNLPIDIFFRSLAEDAGNKAVAIVLSGTGSHGSSGIRSIKENLGMVMAQSEDTAAFSGMPNSAISTGLVDYILPPAEMPAQLLTYLQHPFAKKTDKGFVVSSNEDDLTRIFGLLRERTKIDFTYYKPGTILRRIERRMAINHILDFIGYLHLLESYPAEIDSLHRDLLIGVTRFFRDPDAFKALEDCLPDLFNSKSDQIRIWVAGCSTGEEAYTLAIISQEVIRKHKLNLDVKIFATDVDQAAVQQASSGEYTESSICEIAPELISRYFYLKDNIYKIKRNVREMVVFAQHNLVKDPAFTNIDIISCRNLLIYLQPDLQTKAHELFNFSLNPGGVLMLGSSETTGDMSDYFEPLNAKYRIYRSKGRRRMTKISEAALHFRGESRHNPGDTELLQGYSSQHAEKRLLERFLESAATDYLPFCIIVNEHMKLRHVIGEASNYLSFKTGKAINDVSKLIQKDLAIPLNTGIQKVLKGKEEMVYSNICLRGSRSQELVNMRIRLLPGKKGQEILIAIFIEPVQALEHNKDAPQKTYDIDEDAQQRISDLEGELQYTRENLRTTVEELETSNEELQASNEELLASNEELQSVNEELYTVNSEYQGKITEMTEVNNDLDNLLTNTRVATLFIDEDLEIRRFTPEAAQLFRIMEQDIGRHLGDLTHDFKNLDLIQKAKEVQDTEEKLQFDAETHDGRTILISIYPYQIAPSTYSGLVLTFVDVSSVRRTQSSLEKRSKLLFSLIESIPDGYVLIDAEGIIQEVNKSIENLVGYTSEELTGKNISILMPGDNAAKHHNYLQDYLETKQSTVVGQTRLVEVLHRDGGLIKLELTVSAIAFADGTWFAGLFRTKP